MKRVRRKLSFKILPAAVAIPSLFLFLSAHAIVARQQSAARATVVSAGVNAKMFNTPQQAADELVDAAEKFDVHALEEISDPMVTISFSLVNTRRTVSVLPTSLQRPAKRKRVHRSKEGKPSIPPRGRRRLALPVPLVKLGGRWYFNAKAGRQELLQRRIGADELDAIDICRGYVQAQHEYALQPREGFDVNQYAQSIISIPANRMAWPGKTRTAVGADQLAKRSPR